MRVLCCFLIAGTFLYNEGTKPWLVNIEHAPLQMRLSASRRYIDIANRSRAAIEGFSFGCIVVDDSQRVVSTRQLKDEKGRLDTNEFASRTVAVVKELQAQCGKTDKLAIVRVDFRDGRTWALKVGARAEAAFPLNSE